MKKLIGFLLLIGLIVFLFTTTPEESDHVEALSEALPEFINEKLNTIGLDSELSNDPRVQEFISILGPTFVEVDNYFLCSIGREKLTGDENMISFGIAGHVFTFNDDVVKKAQGFAEQFEGKVKDLDL